jgi:hypothetical protein
MHHKGSQVQSPVASEPLSLLESEWVGRFFHHEEWACPHGLKQDLYLEIQSFRVLSERVGKPALKRSPRILPALKFPTLLNFVEDFLANRSPKSPKEHFVRTNDWDFDTSSDKEPLLIDDVLVGRGRSEYRVHRDSCFAYMSGESAAKLIGKPACTWPHVAHLKVSVMPSS